MRRLTTKEIEEIRKRLELSTQPFWGTQSVELRPHGYKELTIRSALTEVCEINTVKNPNAENDAKFIRDAHYDIPRLLSEIDTLREALGTIESMTRNPNEYQPSYSTRNYVSRQAIYREDANE